MGAARLPGRFIAGVHEQRSDTYRVGKTFRGNNPAFVTATAALREFWSDDALVKSTLAKGERVEEAFNRIVADTSGAEGG